MKRDVLIEKLLRSTMPLEWAEYQREKRNARRRKHDKRIMLTNMTAWKIRDAAFQAQQLLNSLETMGLLAVDLED